MVVDYLNLYHNLGIDATKLCMPPYFYESNLPNTSASETLVAQLGSYRASILEDILPNHHQLGRISYRSFYNTFSYAPPPKH